MSTDFHVPLYDESNEWKPLAGAFVKGDVGLALGAVIEKEGD